MSIYATLHNKPTKCTYKHEMIYITRGASATLVYPLFDKVFKSEDIEQITFIFKQGRDLYGYSMFDDSTTDKKINPHFCLIDDTSDYARIIFNLNSDETKQFRPDINLEYEIAIKLNTDRFEATGNQDSVVIEPQHPIAVVDSLYSYIKEETNAN
jgi:hypothetical protein